jgi:hypothetical protein
MVAVEAVVDEVEGMVADTAVADTAEVEVEAMEEVCQVADTTHVPAAHISFLGYGGGRGGGGGGRWWSLLIGLHGLKPAYEVSLHLWHAITP